MKTDSQSADASLSGAEEEERLGSASAPRRSVDDPV